MIYNDIEKQRLKKGENRTILSVIMNEITIDGKPMDDKNAIKKLQQMKKTTVSNISIYEKANKTKIANEEKEYLKYINKYLPKGVTAEDIEKTITSLGIKKEIKSMGMLMEELKKSFDVIDGSLVKSILLN